MHDHAVLIAQNYAAHAAGQGKPSFSGHIGSREFRHVRQVINVAGGTCLADPKIYQRQTVDGEWVHFSIETQFSIAPAHSDADTNRLALDRYLSRRLRAFSRDSIARKRHD